MTDHTYNLNQGFIHEDGKCTLGDKWLTETQARDLMATQKAKPCKVCNPYLPTECERCSTTATDEIDGKAVFLPHECTRCGTRTCAPCWAIAGAGLLCILCWDTFQLEEYLRNESGTIHDGDKCSGNRQPKPPNTTGFAALDLITNGAARACAKCKPEIPTTEMAEG